MKLLKIFQNSCSNSWQFSIGEKFLCFYHNQVLKLLDNNFNLIDEIEVENGLNRVYLSKYVIILDSLNLPKIYTLKNSIKNYKINLSNDICVLPNQNFNSNILIIQRNIDILNVETGLLNICENKYQIISNTFLANQVLKNNVFSFRKLEIIKYESNGIQLWQFPLSQLSTYITDEDEEKPAELISIIGVHNTILWLLVTDRRLIALDTETGTLLHEINLCEALGIKPQTVENYSFSLGDTHLDEEKEKIKGFAHRYYWELDLNSLQAEIKVDFGQGNTWRIKKSKFYKEDKNLYFTGARNGETFDRAIGIFDTEKCQIIWYDEPLDEGRYLFFTDIQANDKLIGALDSEQNLRIYEKE